MHLNKLTGLPSARSEEHTSEIQDLGHEYDTNASKQIDRLAQCTAEKDSEMQECNASMNLGVFLIAFLVSNIKLESQTTQAKRWLPNTTCTARGSSYGLQETYRHFKE